MGKTLVVTLISLAALTHAFAADGVYQKTRDGKTTVWNSDPKPGDEATWTGDRDREGYAKGFGTLAWYTMSNAGGGRAAAAQQKPELFARYFGNMEQGKFDGPVNVHA